MVNKIPQGKATQTASSAALFETTWERIGTLRNYDGDGNGRDVKTAIGLMSITLFCRFLCRPWITGTWPDQILSLLGNGNGRVINSTISVTTRARSLLFSSNPVSLLLSNWDPWINREKKWKDAKSIFQRRFHGRRRCRIVRSCTNVCGAATSIAESESRRVF